MADFKVKIQVEREGVAVSQPRAVFGHLGVFTGSESGALELEADDLEEELALILPLKITDPSDEKFVVATIELTDDEELTIDMSDHNPFFEEDSMTKLLCLGTCYMPVKKGDEQVERFEDGDHVETGIYDVNKDLVASYLKTGNFVLVEE